jgi:branched-chain amino acid transport system ATP-binding protein
VLAYGDLKRVELAMALANQPRLLLMDEPTAGMAPRERVELMQLAAGLAHARKIAVLFTEHDMDVVFGQADRVDRARPRPPDRPRYAGRGAQQSRRARGLSRGHAVMLPPPMLAVSDLHAHYGQAHILDGVSLEARAGEVVALLGRNGAGKSTTLKAIMGLVAPSQGQVSFDGQRIERLPPLPHRPAGPGLRAGGSAHLHRAHGDGESRGRPAARAHGAPTWTEDKLFALFPNLAACASGRAGACRAASSRCSPSPAP